MHYSAKVLATLGILCGVLGTAHAFGGENLLSSKWRDWHHNTLSRYAAQSAGFFRTGAGESLEEEGVDSPAAEVAWHADFIDSYAYNPLYWAMRGPSGYAAATAIHPDLIKLHFDDLTALPQVRDQYFQYTTGTVAGLLWAKSLYESGQRERGIATARHLVGISLHALQDFYSHSNWVDDMQRGQGTWFYSFTVQSSFLTNTQVYTGSYEHPELLSIKPHGKIAPEISAFQQIRPIMDLLSSPASPVHDLPVMDVWRQYRDRSVPITPGVFPSATESQALAAGLKAPPSQVGVGLPPGSLYVAPPGIALDATYLCKIAAQQRGFSPAEGPRLFQTAYGRAFDGSVQWLKRLEKTMIDQPGGSAFWLAVKTSPPTSRRQACFEDFTDLGFQFIAAGSYPPDSAATQRQLGSSPSAIPAKEYYLRVRLKTSRDALSGTDSDIYLNAGGKRFLLDYAPVGDSGLASAIFAHNDFEGGSDDVYTVGPFAQMPASIELENVSGDFGRVLLALGASFIDSIKAVFQSIGDFFATITGAKPDFVGQEKKIWTAAELAALPLNTSTGFTIDINTANTNKEGIYKVHGTIRCISRNAEGGVYTVNATSLQCIRESDLDQIGSPPGDENFVLAALASLPGNIQKAQSTVKQQTRTGTSKTISEISFTSSRIPNGYGALSFPVCVMESDSETQADRNTLLNKFAGYFENKTSDERRSFLAELGAATAPDWKLERIEVFAFAKGGAVETGTVLAETANRWIPGKGKASFNLNRSALTACNINVLDLQRLTETPVPAQPGEPLRPTEPIKPIKPIKLGDPVVPPTVAPSIQPPTTPQLPGDNGKLGITYQLGEKDRELHFTLESAQVAPFYKTPEATVVAGEDQRLLLLTFTVQNPQKTTDMTVNSSAFKFTAVSPDDKNFLASGPLYQPENGKSYQTALKPAQKVRLQVVLPIYAMGPIRKIIVQRGSGAVLRYDLSEQIGKMKTTFSPDGLELLSEVKVEFGKPFDVSGLEAEVQAVTIHEKSVGRYQPYQDFRIFTVQLKLTNLLARPQQLNWNTLKPTLTDEEGQKLDWQTDYLSLGAKISLNQEVAPGESMRGLLIFKALKIQKPIKLRLVEPGAKRAAIMAIPSLTTEPIKLGDPVVPPTVAPSTQPPAVVPPTPVGTAVVGDKETPLGPPVTTGTGFSLTLPKSVEVGVSFYAPPPLTITVRRPAALKGELAFTLSNAPEGVVGSFARRDENIYTLTLTGLSGLKLGEYKLQVQASVAGKSVTAPLLLIRSKARTLLVDDDFTDNNRSGGDPKVLSPADKTFRTLLERGNGQRALVYDFVTVDSQKPGPNVDALLPYDVVLWYCGTSYGGNPDGNATVGGVDESNLRAYLDEGEGRTLLLFAPGYISNIQGYVPSAKSNEDKWIVTESTFLKRYIGASGGQGLLKRFAEADLDVAGKTVVMGRGPAEAQLSPINASTAQVVATALLNPDSKGERAVPVATANKIGAAHCVFVGFTFENIAIRPERLFTKLLAVRIPGIEGP